MSLFDKLLRRPAKRRETKRHFEGARVTRLTQDWSTSQTSLDTDLQSQLTTLITRARWFEQNSEYGEAYLKLIERNVVGPHPFQLQMKIQGPDGAHDREAESAIEAAWRDWSKKRNCCVTGAMSLADHYRVCVRAMVRDGGHLIQKHLNRGAYGLQLEAKDIDYLDPNYNVDLKDGSRIVMSVELDQMGAPVAYHLLGSHPGDIYQTHRGPTRTRVLARNIIHPFIRKRSNQVRGYTEFASIMPNARQLSSYKEAVLLNARISAAKGGFLEKQTGEMSEYRGDAADDNCGKYMDVEAGVIEELPMGFKYVPNDPKQPTTGYAEFIKEGLRGEAAGLGVAYMSLGNDPGDANFSSARTGIVEEREGYKMLQNIMIEHVCEDIFSDWLMTSLKHGKLLNTKGVPYPAGRYAHFNKPVFRGRRWQWLDPKADSEAAKTDLELGIVSNAQVAGERGGDEEETLDEIEQTLTRRAKAGLVDRARLEAIQAARAFDAAEEEKKEPPLIAALGVGGVQALTMLTGQVATGELQPDAAQALLIEVFGLTEETAARLTKKAVSKSS